MALTPSFTVAQTIGEPSILTINDTSTGSDGSIAERRVYLEKADGTFLVPDGTETDYIVWDYADGNIEIDVLLQDYALQIKVDFVDASGAVLYTVEGLYLFTLYLEEFYYGLTQNQASTPSITRDTTYYSNKMKLRCSIDEAENAVTYGEDIYAAQAALNRGKYLIDNQDKFF
jgi:hypothetical protein